VTCVAFSLVMIAGLFSHTSIVLLVRGRGGQVVAQRPRVRDHLAARWFAHRLDLALADGASPETNAALALRAQRLTEPDRRWSAAGALRRIVRDARNDRRQRFGRVRPDPGVVLAASRELSDLADTLDDPGPVAARGVAQAWLLLTDGTGPLYSPESRTKLVADAAQALRELRPWPA
jgi:hypothetical protein